MMYLWLVWTTAVIVFTQSQEKNAWAVPIGHHFKSLKSRVVRRELEIENAFLNQVKPGSIRPRLYFPDAGVEVARDLDCLSYDVVVVGERIQDNAYKMYMAINETMLILSFK
jgi:hypothetical protein